MDATLEATIRERLAADRERTAPPPDAQEVPLIPVTRIPEEHILAERIQPVRAEPGLTPAPSILVVPVVLVPARLRRRCRTASMGRHNWHFGVAKKRTRCNIFTRMR